MQEIEEDDLNTQLEEEGQEVSPPQTTVFLSSVAIQFGTVFPIFFPVLPFSVLTVGHMHDDEQRWTGDENQLQGPETDVGDGEKMIVANIGAARLPVIAVKILLLISPHPLSSYHINKHTENKDHREPDTAKSSGVFVHSAQQAL